MPGISTLATLAAYGNLSTVRILLVDDVLENRLLVKAYLKKSTCEIAEAEHGESAIELFKATSFDLVLMDLRMPVMDGTTATRLIREWEGIQQKTPTPIVALTADIIGYPGEQIEETGFTSRLAKPVTREALFRHIEPYLQQTLSTRR